MVVLSLWAQLRGIPAHWASGLSAAVFGLLLWQPLALLTPSFWFSVVAVWVLLLASSQGRSFWQTQWWLWCALMPISYGYFSVISWSSLFANPLVIPWFSYTVVPVVIIALLLQLLCPSLSLPVLHLADVLLDCSVVVLQHLTTQIPWGSWLAPGQWAVYGALALGGALLCTTYWRQGACLCAAAWWVWWQPIEHPPLRACLLNVGQGLSVLVETSHHTLLFDTGPSGSAHRVIIPWLYRHGWSSLDGVLISHGDADHAGAWPALQKALLIGWWISGEPRRLGQANQACVQGMHWQWDGVVFDVLSPDPTALDQGNRSSCVLQISYQGYRLLIPGDIDQVVEAALIEQLQAVDVLVAPHHGSQTSSSQAFIDALHPNMVWISAADHNRFGHPHRKVLERYWQSGATVYQSARQGTLCFTVDSDRTAWLSTGH